jgi:hypothetical protein
MIRCAKCGSKVGVTGPCKTCKRNAAAKNPRLTQREVARAQTILGPLVDNAILFDTTHVSDLTEIAAELIESGKSLLKIAAGRTR